jgi:PST family polysaccharide transporter
VVSDKAIFLFTSVATQALRVAAMFVMARLLRPEDYGLLTLVAIAPGFIALLGDCGIARALVQYRDLPTEPVEASGLVVSVMLGLIYAIVYLCSGIYFFSFGYHVQSGLVRHDQRMFWIGLIGGVTIVLSTIYTFQMACLNRDLKFKAESVQNIIFSLAVTVTGVGLALVAHWHRAVGVFALALQPLTAQIVGNAVIYHRHPFRWPSAFRYGMAAKMLGYGWKVTLAQYVNNLQQTIVSACVAVVGGPVGLGVYGRATQVSDMFGWNLMNSIDRLLHPLLRTVRDDAERRRGIFVRGCLGSMLMCGFGWAWLEGTAPDLIRVVMGPQWSSVPPLLRIVSITLLSGGLGIMGIIVTHALGKPLIWLRFGVAGLLVLLLCSAAALGLGHSLAAIAVAFVIAQVTMSLALWVWAVRTLNVGRGELAGHLIRLLLVAGATCGCILLVRHQLASQAPLVRLIAGSAAGGLVFMALAFLVDREAITTFRTMVRRRDLAEPPASQPSPPSVWQAGVEVAQYERSPRAGAPSSENR